MSTDPRFAAQQMKETTELRLAFFDWVKKLNYGEKLEIPEDVLNADAQTAEGRKKLLGHLHKLDFNDDDVFEVAAKAYISNLVSATSSFGIGTFVHVAIGSTLDLDSSRNAIRPSVGLNLGLDEVPGTEKDDYIKKLIITVLPEAKATTRSELKEDNTQGALISRFLMDALQRDFGKYGTIPKEMTYQNITKAAKEIELGNGKRLDKEDVRANVGAFWEVELDADLIRNGLREIFFGNKDIYLIHRPEKPGEDGSPGQFASQVTRRSSTPPGKAPPHP